MFYVTYNGYIDRPLIEQKIAETFFRHFMHEFKNGGNKEICQQIMDKNAVMKRCVDDKIRLDDIIAMYVPKQ